MNKEEKMKLLEKLVREGHITLCEAFHLLETEKEYVYVPTPQYTPYVAPYTEPYNPYNQKYIVTVNNSTI